MQKKVIAKLKNLQSTQFECEYYKILGTSIFNIQSFVVFPIKLQSFVQLFLYIKKYIKKLKDEDIFFLGVISLGRIEVLSPKIVINLRVHITSFTVKENHIGQKTDILFILSKGLYDIT